MNPRLLFPLCLALLAGGAHAQSVPEKINGDVIALDAGTLQVRNAKAQTVAVKLGPTARITTRTPADLTTLAPGLFLGRLQSRNRTVRCSRAKCTSFPKRCAAQAKATGRWTRPATR